MIFRAPTRNHSRATLVAGAAVLVVGGLAWPASAAEPSATISGTAGENVSTTDHYDGRYLRYVGEPQPPTTTTSGTSGAAPPSSHPRPRTGR